MTVWRMAFRDYSKGPSFWPECKRLGVAAITYSPVADVDFSRFATKKPTPGWDRLKSVERTCLRRFIDAMKAGDVIYVKEGPAVVARGIVAGPYSFDAVAPIVVPNGKDIYHHQRRVRWYEFQPVKAKLGKQQVMTLVKLSSADVEAIETKIAAWP
jgi:hypothetical protein